MVSGHIRRGRVPVIKRANLSAYKKGRGPLKNRSKFKTRGRSYTKTVTKNRKPRGKSQAGMVGRSFCRKNHYNKRVSKMRKMCSPSDVEANGALRIDAAQNAQNYGFFPFFACASDNSNGAGRGTSIDEMCDAMNSLNTYDPRSRTIFKGFKVDMTMTNCTTQTIVCKILDIVPRHDICIGDGNRNQPTAAWINGLALSDVASTTNGTTYVNPTITDVGQMPYSSSLFTENYKVIKQQVLQIEPGGNHRHCIQRKLDLLLPKVRWNSGPASNSRGAYDLYQLAKVTHTTVIIFYSMPANDASDHTRVGVPASSLDVVWHYKATGQFIYDNTRTITRISNVVCPLLSMTTPETIAEGQSTVIPMAVS